MIRREFLKNAAALASGLAAKISYAAPCPPLIDGTTNADCSESNLDRRTRELTSGNTPQLNVNYFRSAEGANPVNNNTTLGQGSTISWQMEGIYYDPIRRRMHQLDRQHNGAPEHAYYDEVDNSWTKVDASLLGEINPGHWRACAFVPQTGKIYYRKEGTDYLYIYDPRPTTDLEGTWSRTQASGNNLSNSNAGNAGYHANLFGPNEPGILTGAWSGTARFVAYNIREETWHLLNTSSAGNLAWVVLNGWSTYLPGRDELIMCCGEGSGYTNSMYAFAAGAGLEDDLSTSNSANARNIPPKVIRNSGGGGNNFCYACTHPRQPDVILAFDAANSNVYYTTDGGETPWNTTSGLEHPFASEFNTTGQYTVGSLPYHGVVAGAAASGENNTKFVFWKPPLV